MRLADPVQFVPGVGPQRAERLARLEISSVGELLGHLPRSYVDRTRVRPLADLLPGIEATCVATVTSIVSQRVRGGLSLVRATLSDESASATAVWFNQPFLIRQLKAGTRLLLHGKVRLVAAAARLELQAPEYEVLPPGGVAEALSGGRLVPVYPSTQGISQKGLRRAIHEALEKAVIEDALPEALAAQIGGPSLALAYRHAHFPEDEAQAEAARRRIAFDELFWLQLALGLVKNRQGETPGPTPARDGDPPPSSHPRGSLTDRFRSALPFTLTPAQERAVTEISADIERSTPMNRLLQGDVGSGKTVVAALAALRAIECGFQLAYLAPTEVLAAQQAASFRSWFEPLGLKSGLLLGRTRAGERRPLLERLVSGELAALIGTHALLEGPVEFARLGLVVVDEQHRFGVRQRARLREKGRSPHTLVMSATPIPRTLAMTLYGDLDLTVLDEMPPGRTPPTGRLVPEARRGDLLRWTGAQLAQGRRAYFVYPLVEESEELEMRAATQMAAELALLPGFREGGVALLHGRLAGEEKEQILGRFRRGEVRCLVATTVIEVGVDVPEATILVIEHPERFGLSQLHQLRGRIGRGGGESHFFMVVGRGVGRESMERLRILLRETSGFRVAEEDLRLRGPGELMGTAQHGLPTLRAADLTRDQDLLQLAHRKAGELLRLDPGLNRPEQGLVRARLLELHGQRLPLVDVG